MDFSNFQWWLVLIAVGAIGAFIWMRARRKGNPDIDSAFLESRQAPDFAPTRVAARRSASTARSEPAEGASALFDDMRDDPVAGASILTQSGRSKEAEQVLIRASLADPERNEAILARIPAGHWGKPQEIGGAAVFLASDAAAYVHGVVLPVDGGWLAR